MAETSLVFNILAKDNATRTFDKVKARAVLLGAAVGALGAKFGVDAVRNASALNETLNKSSVIFGRNEKAMERWASSASTNLGLSKAAALEAASGFGNMFSQLGFAGDQSAKMSRSVVKLSADLGSFNNLPTADVSDMIAAAFRGEYDSLQRLIPNINAARVQQEAMTMTGKKSADQLTAQEKAAATLAIVQRDGAAANNDFAKTSGGLANQQKILRARYEDVSAAVGNKLLPVVTDLMGSLLAVIGFTQRHATATKVAIGVVALAATTIGGLVVASKIHAVVLAAQTEGTFAYAAAQKASAVWAKVVTAAQWAWNAALSANPIGLVIIAIAALVAGIIIAYKHSDKFREAVDHAFHTAATAGQAMWNALKAVFKFVTNAWMSVVGAIVHGAASAFGWVPGIGPKLKKAAKEFDQFRDRVNASLSGIQRTIPISFVAIGTSAPNSRYAGKQLPIDGRVSNKSLIGNMTVNNYGPDAAGDSVAKSVRRKVLLSGAAY